MNEEIQRVDVAYVKSQIDALTRKRMNDSDFVKKTAAWYEETPTDALTVAVNVLKSGSNFFNGLGLDSERVRKPNLLRKAAAIDFLVEIKAADAGQLPLYVRGEEVFFQPQLLYYLLLKGN